MPMTEKQRLALEAGRARLAAKRAAKRDGKRTGSTSPILPPVSPSTSESPSQPETPRETSTGSLGGSSDSVDADTLAFVFDSASMPAQEKPDEKAGILGSILNRKPEPPKGKTAQDRKERDAQAAASEWGGVAATLFTVLCVQLVGDDLKPSPEQANDITAPLVRILMRHIDPLREASADTIDAMTALAALTIYVQGIWPAIQAKQAARKLKVIRGTAHPEPARPAPVAAAAPPANSAGHSADPVRSGAGTAPERSRGFYTGPVADVGLAALEEALGV